MRASLPHLPFALIASAWAIDCPPGYYTDGVSIFPAPVGSFVPTANATTPTLCPLGYYTPVEGMRQAIPASPGYHVPVAGSAKASLELCACCCEAGPG
jgi:hypothetical protein